MSVIIGVSLAVIRYRIALKTALFFGGFQALMPVLGWLAGIGLSDFISGFDHWIASGLLLAVGLKMILEAFKVEQCDVKNRHLCVSSMVVLSIATSIDAFAVGVGFAFLDMVILLPVIIIGVVTFFMSFIGVIFGSKIGVSKGKRLEIVGGVVLILVGLRVVLEHYLF